MMQSSVKRIVLIKHPRLFILSTLTTGAPQAIRLNEEEMAAVDRLTEMGFDRADAAQAFLACDKNEALAANLLMDSAGQEGGVFGFQDDDNNNGGDAGGGNDNDGDDMYD